MKKSKEQWQIEILEEVVNGFAWNNESQDEVCRYIEGIISQLEQKDKEVEQ